MLNREPHLLNFISRTPCRPLLITLRLKITSDGLDLVKGLTLECKVNLFSNKQLDRQKEILIQKIKFKGILYLELLRPKTQLKVQQLIRTSRVLTRHRTRQLNYLPLSCSPSRLRNQLIQRLLPQQELPH